MIIRKLLFSTLLTLFLCSISIAQECKPPEIIANANSENIFSPEQEMIFGDLFFQNMSDEIRLVQDEKLNRYIRNIGDKLTKHIPETGLKYKFYIIDIPEANAFNIPGGYVFVSRKLISFSKDEDELAGVMAHELGHAVVKHGATDMSVLMRKVLKVTELGDKADVIEKYNLLIEKARTKRVRRKSSHQSKQQLEADEIGLYSMVAAGYNPKAFTSFYDRLAETEGKTGSWFSDLFGNTSPSEKRLRRMLKITENLPVKCKEQKASNSSEDFLKFQAEVVSYRERNRKESLRGLIVKKELTPKLRSDIRSISISSDGKNIIAQDDFAITVIQRKPLKVLFQIPALEANRVSFTPDDSHVVFVTDNLRYEKWNIAEQKPVEVRELVLRRDCWEDGLSPDGKYMACVDTSMRVQIIDTRTGKRVWEKKKAFELSYFEYISWISAQFRSDGGGSFFNIVFSPNSKYLVISRSHKYRYRLSVNGLSVGKTDNKVVALDLKKLEEIDVDKDLRKYTIRPFAFVDNEKIIAMHNRKYDQSGVFSFPDGKRISKFTFGGDELKTTANPKYVIIKPLQNIKMGVFDTEKGIVATGINKSDATMWKNLFIYEAASGKIIIRETKYNEKEKRFDSLESETIDIPASSLGNLYAAEVSSNFNWLTFSSKSRGGIWNLKTGERKMIVRGFRGAVMADDGASVAEFPAQKPINHSLVLLDANKKSTRILRELPKRGARQYGRFVLTRKSLEEPKSKKKDDDKEERKPSLYKNVRFELKDFVKNTVVWSKDFPKRAPGYFFDDFSGRIICFWRVGSEGGKEKLKEYPEIEQKAKSMKDDEDNYFIEVIDAFAGGKIIGKVIVQTGNRSFSIAGGLSERNWLVLYDSEGRVITYKMKEGELHNRFFGHHAAVNPAKNQILVENFPGEVKIYDIDTGETKAKLNFNGNVVFARYSLNGKALFILTDTQTAYIFDVDKVVTPVKLG